MNETAAIRSTRATFRAAPLVRASVVVNAVALPAVAAAPRHWPWIAGAVVADHLALVAAGLLPRCALLGPNLRHDAAAAKSRAVALTFDDGPDPEVTPAVLDMLDRHQARASFFCIGRRVEEHPALASEIVGRGHAIENHTHTHASDFLLHSPRRIDRELSLCQEAIFRATGATPRLFRAPAGVRSPLLARALSRHGLTLASWTRRGFDTVARDAAAVTRRLTRRVQPGDVLLLHDRSRHGSSPMVLEVLPRLLEILRGAGLSALPLSVAAEPAVT